MTVASEMVAVDKKASSVAGLGLRFGVPTVLSMELRFDLSQGISLGLA